MAETSKLDLKPEFQIGAEANFFLELAHSPSSVQGQSRFDFALLQISPEIKVDEKVALYFRFVLAEERSTSEKNYLTELQNAFIRYRDLNHEYWIHELGLIRSAWHNVETEIHDLDFFGDPGRSLARRYGLVAEGDLGYQGHYKKNDKRSWVFGITNGEENKENEKGPNKEVFVGHFFQQQDLIIRIWGSAGRVDRIDTELSDKQRIFLAFQKRFGRSTLGVEGVYAKDSSLDLEANGRFEGITFTELLQPREINTSGYRLDLGYDLSSTQKVILRFDEIRPGSNSKKLQSFETAWIKKESSNLIWGLFIEKTEFGAQHSSQSRQRERARLGIEIVF